MTDEERQQQQADTDGMRPAPESVEQTIQRKGLNAPRVTPRDLDANVAHTEIRKHVAPSGQVLRFAIITALNGFAFAGKPSAAVSSENDDAEVGERIAIQNTRETMWAPMGYALRERLDPVRIARICHEANRALCQAFGDFSQQEWDKAAQWQRDSVIAGVRFHLANPDAGPEASHDEWCRVKIADGWQWGPTKNPDLKLHPCLVQFNSLPPEQQAKDHVFRAIVHAEVAR